MEDTVEEVLAHFGVKGMKWGVRKRRKIASEHTPVSTGSVKTVDTKKPTPVQVRVVPGKRVQTRGGSRQPTTAEAIRAAALKQKAKKSGPQALTNEEMSFLVTRLGLEEKLSKVAPKQKTLGQRFVKDFLPSPAAQALLKAGTKKLPANTHPNVLKGADFAEKMLKTLADNKKSQKKSKN